MNIIRAINFRTKTYNNPTIPLVWRKIIAAGLGSIVQKMINNGSWGIIPAHSYVDELKNYLRKRGSGFIMMQGAWVGGELSEYIDENSLLLPLVNEVLLKAIAHKYSEAFYIFAQKKKFQIKDARDGQVIQESAIKKYFKQFYNKNNELQYANSKTKKLQWTFDRNIPSRSNLVADEISKEKNEQVTMGELKLKLRIPNPSYAFITWKKRPKYVGWEGIMAEESDNFTPPGSSLSAYLPLNAQ